MLKVLPRPCFCQPLRCCVAVPTLLHCLPNGCIPFLQRRSYDDSDVLLRRGTVLYDFNSEEEDEVSVSKGETVEVEYEVGGWVQVRLLLAPVCGTSSS